MMVTAHSKMFESSTRPAEKPSTGFLVSSAMNAHVHVAGELLGQAVPDATECKQPHLSAVSAAETWRSPSCPRVGMSGTVLTAVSMHLSWALQPHQTVSTA